jgi:hypothetical protein
MLCKSCRPTHKEYNKIGFAIFGFFYDFIWILQASAKTHKRVKNLIANRPLERFESSQIYPWFAQKTLERAQDMQCGPWGLGAARLGEIRWSAYWRGPGKGRRGVYGSRATHLGVGLGRKYCRWVGTVEASGGRCWSSGSGEPTVRPGQHTDVGARNGPSKAA